MDYLASSDELCAVLKGGVQRAEFMAKVTERLAFSRETGNNEERKAKAGTSAEVIEAHEAYFNAVVEYEKVRAKRERAVLTVEVWKSLNANRRMGMVA